MGVPTHADDSRGAAQPAVGATRWRPGPGAFWDAVSVCRRHAPADSAAVGVLGLTLCRPRGGKASSSRCAGLRWPCRASPIESATASNASLCWASGRCATSTTTIAATGGSRCGAPAPPGVPADLTASEPERFLPSDPVGIGRVRQLARRLPRHRWRRARRLGRDRWHRRRRLPDGRAEDAHPRARRPLTGAGARQRRPTTDRASAGATKRAGYPERVHDACDSSQGAARLRAVGPSISRRAGVR